MNSIQPLYTIPEIAEYWNVSEKTIIEATKKGSLKGFRDGKTFKTRYQQIESWLESMITATFEPIKENRGRKPSNSNEWDVIGRNVFQ